MPRNETAMRDAEGNPVFVRNDGSYSETFPEENIVERGDSDAYKVFFFLQGYGEEWSRLMNGRQEALDFASDIYGKKLQIRNIVRAEVYEVEVHQL